MCGGGRRSLRVGRIAVLVSATAIMATHVRAAFAQSDEDRGGARVAATEGLQAFKDKKWAEAVDRFTCAESLVHAPTHLLYLARAQANLGELVKAQEIYQRVVKENLPPNAPKAFLDAQADAQKELKDLEPRIPYVKAVIDGSGKNPMATVDGVPIPSALIGVHRPISPGRHSFQA